MQLSPSSVLATLAFISVLVSLALVGYQVHLVDLDLQLQTRLMATSVTPAPAAAPDE